MNIKLTNINKRFDDVQALNNINLEFEHGKVYGLIGRNGAGKTTLLKTISKMLTPSSGEIDCKGLSIAYSRSENPSFDMCRSKSLFNIARAVYPNYNLDYEKELIEKFNPDLKKIYGKLSSGMKNTINLIIALSANPDVLLLDEPYVGLDPINREVLYRFLVDNYFDGEHTVVISTHMITEIEGYFENAIVIDKGKIIIEDELEKIREKAIVVSVKEEVMKTLESKVNVLSVDNIGSRYDVYIYDDVNKVNEIIVDTEIHKMDLQTLMIKMLVGKEGRS